MTSPLWLDLDGAANARDVGARPVVGGGAVRSGRLLRSDSPVGLSERDVRQLVDLGLDTVVDLRTGVEVRAEGHGPLADADGVTVHHLSLFPEGAPFPEGRPLPPTAPAGVTAEASEPVHGGPTAEPGSTAAGEPEVLPWQDPTSERARATARRTYLRYLDERPDSVVTALRLIAHSRGATLVHCAAGKDRTGVVVALALSTVGVPRAEIVADYVASAERIEAILARLGASATYAADPALGDVDRHRPKAETIEGFLDQLDTQDGGAAGWLQAHGWTDADQGALLEQLVGP